MKNIIKGYTLFSTVALMVLIVFSGITCFAVENQPLIEETGYVVSADYEIVDPNITVTMDIDDEPEIQSIARSKSKSKEDKSIGKNLAIGLGSGFVIAVIVCVCIFISYKKHGATEPYNYNDNAKLTLIDSSDVLVNTHIEKRKIEKD